MLSTEPQFLNLSFVCGILRKNNLQKTFKGPFRISLIVALAYFKVKTDHFHTSYEPKAGRTLLTKNFLFPLQMSIFYTGS